MIKKNGIITILIGFIVLVISLVLFYNYKEKLESLKVSINTQETYALSKVLKKQIKNLETKESLEPNQDREFAILPISTEDKTTIE
jgi:uncharacterized protein YpmB